MGALASEATLPQRSPPDPAVLGGPPITRIESWPCNYSDAKSFRMGEIVFIDAPRIFTLEEARALMPVVRRLTERHREKSRELRTKLLVTREPRDQVELEQAIHEVMRTWAGAIARLGCHARPQWTVDFDCGQGYYCWKHPEPTLAHYHRYDEGYSSRVPVVD
jgi:hypothetical protein